MKSNQEIYEVALNKVLNFLSYSSRSKKEVVDRINRYLLKKKLSEDEKEAIKTQVLSDLENLRLLDDTGYANSYVEGRLRSGKPISKRKISEYLYKKGIDKEIIEKALESYTGENEKELVEELAQKKLRTLKAPDMFTAKQKLTSYLLGKGFSPSIVFDTVNHLFTQQ